MKDHKMTTTIGADPARSIDMTPTWGEVGLMFLRFAVSSEVNALRHGAPEFAKAFGMAEALSKLFPELTDEQRARCLKIIEKESAKTERAVK